MPLRPYQSEAISSLRSEFTAGKRRVLLVMPTGSGKGNVHAEIASSAAARGRRVLFVVSGRQLVEEFGERLTRHYGLAHGVVMAGRPRSDRPVQVASIDTLASMVRRGAALPEADVILLDEADLAVAPRFDAVLTRYPAALVIATTATPVRQDGKGLGRVFDSMVVGATVRGLIDARYLVEYEGLCFGSLHVPATTPKSKGDWNVEKVHLELMGAPKEKLLGDIVEKWHKHAGQRRTVGFAMTRAHSREVVERFNAERVGGAPIAHAEHVDGDMSLDVRREVFGRVLRGETHIVSNVGVICRGVDLPCLEVVAQWRPTLSLALCLQQWGRGFRLSPETGKTKLLILDHVGNVERHGLPDGWMDESNVIHPHEWNLGDGLVMAQQVNRLPSLATCHQCFAMYVRKPACPVCGAGTAAPTPRKHSFGAGKVSETDVRTKARQAREARLAAMTPDERAQEDEKRLRWIVSDVLRKGHSLGAARHRFANGDAARMPSWDTLKRIEREVRSGA